MKFQKRSLLFLGLMAASLHAMVIDESASSNAGVSTASLAQQVSEPEGEQELTATELREALSKPEAVDASDVPLQETLQSVEVDSSSGLVEEAAISSSDLNQGQSQAEASSSEQSSEKSMATGSGAEVSYFTGQSFADSSDQASTSNYSYNRSVLSSGSSMTNVGESDSRSAVDIQEGSDKTVEADEADDMIDMAILGSVAAAGAIGLLVAFENKKKIKKAYGKIRGKFDSKYAYAVEDKKVRKINEQLNNPDLSDEEKDALKKDKSDIEKKKQKIAEKKGWKPDQTDQLDKELTKKDIEKKNKVGLASKIKRINNPALAYEVEDRKVKYIERELENKKLSFKERMALKAEKTKVENKKTAILVNNKNLDRDTLDKRIAKKSELADDNRDSKGKRSFIGNVKTQIALEKYDKQVKLDAKNNQLVTATPKASPPGLDAQSKKPLPAIPGAKKEGPPSRPNSVPTPGKQATEDNANKDADKEGTKKKKSRFTRRIFGKKKAEQKKQERAAATASSSLPSTADSPDARSTASKDTAARNNPMALADRMKARTQSKSGSTLGILASTSKTNAWVEDKAKKSKVGKAVTKRKQALKERAQKSRVGKAASSAKTAAGSKASSLRSKMPFRRKPS